MSRPRLLLLLFVLLMLLFESKSPAYTLSGHKWPAPVTTYYAAMSGPWDQAFEEAAGKWNSTTNFKFTVVKGSYWDPCSNPNQGEARNGVKFSETFCGDAWGTGVLAVTSSWSVGSVTVQAGIAFNSNRQWSAYDGPSTLSPLDFRRIAVHELGHALGLGHEDVAPAIMATNYATGGTIIAPQPDDIAGANFLYAGSCTFSISPPAQSFGTNGGTGNVTVTAGSGCSWTSSSNVSWITITAGNSGAGNGVVSYFVAANTGAAARSGQLSIAGQTFSVDQAGQTVPNLPDLTLTSVTNPSTGSSGGQISVAAQLRNQGAANAGTFRLGFYLSTDATITTSDIFIGSCAYPAGLAAGVVSTCNGSITLSPSLAPRKYFFAAIVDDQNAVGETNEANNSLLGNSIIVSGPALSLFVPIVLSAAGLNNSFFTSELTLTNRGASSVTLTFNYTAAFGSGNGAASRVLPAGQQQIFPDAIAYLRALGINIPSFGSNGGTLRVQVSGAASTSDVGISVRTTTAVPGGRAGLAYPGLPSSLLLTGPAYLCGLRQDSTDRSNVAIQNAGDPSQGSITLRLSVYDGQSSLVSVLPLETLAPGEFRQISGILTSNGLSIQNGYVRVDRIIGAAPYFAYGVINDQANSDGSFVPPISESSLVGNYFLTLPVIVETSSFNTEVVLTNWSTQKRTVSFYFRSDAIPTASHGVYFQIEINAGAQYIYPDFVQFLRTSGIAGIGPRGPAFVGALSAFRGAEDMSGIGLAARTATPGGGGKYGLYYTSVPRNSSRSTSGAWVYGLQQNAENRSNLALVNPAVPGLDTSVFDIEIFDGDTGLRVNTIRGVSVQADGWLQLSGILADYAPGTQQGYARVTRTSGANPFVVYAVINDGAQAGLRSGDGAFVTSQP